MKSKIVLLLSIVNVIAQPTVRQTTCFPDLEFYPCLCSNISGVDGGFPFISLICRRPVHDSQGTILISQMKYLVLDGLVIHDAFWDRFLFSEGPPDDVVHTTSSPYTSRRTTTRQPYYYTSKVRPGSPLLLPQLSGIRVREFTVRDSKIHNSFLSNEYYFSNQTNFLHSLTLSNCSFGGELRQMELLNNLGLDYLDLSRNKFTKISASAFRYRIILKEIHLERNLLSSIENGTFSYLSTLRFLDISHNKLQEISSEIFPKKGSLLRKLNLGYNEIKTLDKEIFHNLKFLEELHLEFNFLYEIPHDLWTVPRATTNVNLNGNFLHCGCYMKSKSSMQVEGICQAPPSFAGYSITQIFLKCEEMFPEKIFGQ